MRAVIYDRYGPPDVLRLAEVPTPAPADDQALIQIHAVSINGSDRERLIGRPAYARMSGLFRPGDPILGSDIAGRVAAIGRNHTEFKIGDEVFGEVGSYSGGFAEYVCTRGRHLALKPPGLSFEQAAAIPQAGTIALLGIREAGRVRPGQRVLVNGAGGSAGPFAVQLAVLAGAEVTGVDSGDKLDFLRSMGAAHVVDYTREDYTRRQDRYDLILDVVAHRSVFDCARALAPNGTYLYTGGSVGVLLQILLLGPAIRRRTSKNLRMLMVPQSRKALLEVTELCMSGQITPVIDRTYSLAEAPQAMRYVAEGHACGKVVINVAGDRD